MPMTPEHRARMLVDTREAAIALLEDCQHLRELLASADVPSAEIRRMSAILRRLLVDEDITTVAAPRTGKIKLSEPDNNPIYRASRKLHIPFFASAGVSTFGTEIRAILALARAYNRPAITDFDPERRIDVRLDGFLSQRVLCLDNTWVSRANAIKYAANIASGVHSGSAKTDADKTIRRMRQCVSITANGGACNVAVNLDAIEGREMPLAYKPSALDPVMVELMAAARFLVESADTQTLEVTIAREVGATEHPSLKGTR